jgi:hypothetical protein
MECLLTTLKGVADDTSLLKLDEFAVDVDTDVVASFDAYYDTTGKSSTARIEGDGYFTDSTGTGNLGKSITITDSIGSKYISPGKYKIVFDGKSQLDHIIFGAGIVANTEMLWGLNSLKSIRLDDLRVDGSILMMKYNPRVEAIRIASKKVIGRFDSLSGSDKIHYLYLNSPKIKGTVQDLVKCVVKTGGVSLLLSSTGLSGNLADFTSVPGLKTLYLSSTQVTGDTSDLAPLSGTLTTFVYANTAITGTWPLT